MRERLPTHPTLSPYEARGLGHVCYIAVHHSGPAPLGLTAKGAALATANYHVNPHGPNDEEWPGCGYHVIIVPSGDWAYCADIRLVSYHVGRVYNPLAVGACMWGDYRNAEVPAIMVDSLEEVCRWIGAEMRAANIVRMPEIVGHQQLAATECPGRFGMLAVEEVKRRLQ